MKKVLGFIKARLSEPSTWRGFVMIAGALGLLNLEQSSKALEIIMLVMGTSGAIGVLASEPPAAPTPRLTAAGGSPRALRQREPRG